MHSLADYIDSNAKFQLKEHRWTKKQQELLRIIQDKNNPITFISGPAGCSKSSVAIFSALKSLQEGKTKQFLYLRSLVESSYSKAGILPGTLEAKTVNYMAPLYDKMDFFVGRGATDELTEGGIVKAECINFLRGVEWQDKFILIDEANNMYPKELLTAMTRIGKNCKMVICGDPQQADIGTKSGFKLFFDLFNTREAKFHGINTFEFGNEDILRNPLIKFIIQTTNSIQK